MDFQPARLHDGSDGDMTRLQLAIDLEAGTPLIKRFGLDAIRSLRAMAPSHLVVADMKAMDAGGLEAEMAFEAGADLMTVLGCASDATIAAAVAVARERGKGVVADLIGVPDKVARARELADLGVDYLGIHTGTDDQATGRDPLADLAAVRSAVNAPLVVAGGINEATLPAILAQGPEIVIVGSGILGKPDPFAAASRLHELLARQGTSP
jgi:3-hexulose-6-phosphate synthase